MDIGKDLQRAYDDGYAKAIDEFVKTIMNCYDAEKEKMGEHFKQYCFVSLSKIDEIAELLKAGGKHE